MYLPSSLLSLPASILLLIFTAPTSITSQELEWPYNLPSHIKYFPEDEALVKREISLQKMLQQKSPVGVKKMSPNPDEKFYLDYWSLDPETDYNLDSWTNSSTRHKLEACSALHADKESPKFLPRNFGFPLTGRSLFEKRDFQCPVNTEACTAIGYPDSCCSTGSTCQVIEDTGYGSVGCCPEGQTCAGGISSCPTDYTSCPQGGGCCIPGYACLDVGCVQTATATVYLSQTTTPPTAVQGLISTKTITLTTVLTPSSAPPTTRTSTTIVVVVYTPPSPTSTSSSYSPTSTSTSSYTTSTTTTRIIVPTASTSTRTTTTTSYTTSSISTSVYTCEAGFKSCASYLGGGCCPTDRACGSNGLCPELSSTGTIVPPYRPTTDSTTTTSSFSSVYGAVCPTGYYACSAYYQAGCCQIGRDCAKTNCPASVSTTLVSGNGITIVAPTGSGISTQVLTGTCATGWYSCAAGYGGGCCPSGYGCGTSCTATATGANGATVAKEPPQQGGASQVGGGTLIWNLALVCTGIVISIALL